MFDPMLPNYLCFPIILGVVYTYWYHNVIWYQRFYHFYTAILYHIYDYKHRSCIKIIHNYYIILYYYIIGLFYHIIIPLLSFIYDEYITHIVSPCFCSASRSRVRRRQEARSSSTSFSQNAARRTLGDHGDIMGDTLW